MSSPDIHSPWWAEGSPWWVKTFYWIGLSTVLSAFLVYYLVTGVDAKLKTIEEDLRLHKVDSQYSIKSSEEQVKKLNDIILILQKICVDMAISKKAATAQCFGDK